VLTRDFAQRFAPDPSPEATEANDGDEGAPSHQTITQRAPCRSPPRRQRAKADASSKQRR
jgi:hypothetical protein